jgi:hypothetical protein
MAASGNVTIAVKADTSSIARAARIIAKHLTAMADELEQPDYLVKFDKPLSADQVGAFKDSFRRHFTEETPDATA